MRRQVSRVRRAAQTVCRRMNRWHRQSLSGRCAEGALGGVAAQENNALPKMCVTEFIYKMSDPTCRNSHCSILLITDRWHDLFYGHWTQHSCRLGSFTMCESTSVYEIDTVGIKKMASARRDMGFVVITQCKREYTTSQTSCPTDLHFKWSLCKAKLCEILI